MNPENTLDDAPSGPDGGARHGRRPRGALARWVRALTIRQRVAVFALASAVVTVACVLDSRVWMASMGAADEAEAADAQALEWHQDAVMMHSALRGDVMEAIVTAADGNGAASGEESDTTGGDGPMARAHAQVERHAATLAANLDRIASLPLSPEIARAFDDNRLAMSDYAVTASRLATGAFVDPVRTRAELPAFVAAFEESGAALAHLTDDILEPTIDAANARGEQARVDFLKRGFYEAVCAFVVTILCMLTFGLDFLGALREVRAVAQQLARGDFSVRNARLVDDEVGDLARAFNRLGDSLQATMAEVAADAARSKFGAQLGEALEMAATDAEAAEAVGRAMLETAPGRPIELLLADSSHAHLRVVAASLTEGRAGCGVESPWGCVAVRRATTMVFPDGQAINACPRLRDRGSCSAVCVPVSFMGRAIGVLHASGPKEDVADPEVVARMGMLASEAGTRIGTIRMLERTQLRASTDGLTGLMNRRALEEAVGGLTRTHTPYAVAMIDLDHFKRLNDTFGHEAGDRALRLFSQTVLAQHRPNDLAARIGGEEFVLVLPGCGVDAAREVAERLRSALAAAMTGTAPAFTMSCGIADGTMASDFEGVLRIADAAVYQAKEQGRDRVVLAQAGQPPRAARLMAS